MNTRLQLLLKELYDIKDVKIKKYLKLICIYSRGRRVIGILGSLIWSKTLMELIFIPCGEFRWSPKGPIKQIYSLHLHAFKVFADSEERESGVRRATGSYLTSIDP